MVVAEVYRQQLWMYEHESNRIDDRKKIKKQAQNDERFRNAIEGKFGQAKRRYGLNCITTKLSETSETSIAITFLVINLSTLLRQVGLSFFVFISEYL